MIVVPASVHYLLHRRILARSLAFGPEQTAAVTELFAAANEQVRDATTLRVTAAGTAGTGGTTRLLAASRRLVRIVVDSHLEAETRGTASAR